jgi:hypothetical protein
MRKHDWPALLKAQAASGQTIAQFCDARGLTRSTFYAERSKLGGVKALIPIRVAAAAAEIRLTLHLRTPVVIGGTAADLAQVLRCL